MGVAGTILSRKGCTRAHPHLTHSCLRGSESGQDTWLETLSVSTHRPCHSSVPCHTVTAAKKGAPLAHQRGSCHHPPLWCCKGCGLPHALDNCLSYHQRAGATTLPLVTSNTEWCLYFFLKKGTFNCFFLRGSLAAVDSFSRPQHHPHHGSPSCSGPWSWLGKRSYPDSKEGSPSPFPKARV